VPTAFQTDENPLHGRRNVCWRQIPFENRTQHREENEMCKEADQCAEQGSKDTGSHEFHQ
jgi:hypothetical protein